MASRRSRPRLLGLPIPDELNRTRANGSKVTRSLNPKRLASQIDVKSLTRNVGLTDVMRHIGNLAETVEARSDDVRALSAQVKRLTRRLT